LTIPILFPFREVAEGNRTASQGVIDRETARLQLIQDNSAHQDAIRDYTRSRLRLKQLQDKDLILAETMKESALEAYRRGNLQFSDLMLARQTYAGLKTEDIQIRSEIVNAHLLCLGDVPEQDNGNPWADASKPPAMGNILPSVSNQAVAGALPLPAGGTPGPVPALSHRLGANQPPENLKLPDRPIVPVSMTATPAAAHGEGGSN